MNPIPFALSGLALCALTLPLAAGASSSETPLDQLSKEEQMRRRETPEVLVVRAATPSVVYIQTNTPRVVQSFWGQQRVDSQASGSGVVLTADGFLVTNYHVVKGATAIRISFEKSIDNGVYNADLVSFVEEEDLALLKIRNPGGREFETIPMGTSSDLMIGEPVVAIGNPYGHTHTVSVGIISGLHRGVKISDPARQLKFNFDDLIQTDASINPGNSGGPLLNINGELIGINNAVNTKAENIGFAIPIDRVQEVLTQQLISPDRYNAWLGFDTGEDDSLVVTSVLAGSPAHTAGLHVGDQIIGLGASQDIDAQQYKLERLTLRPGEQATLRVKRDGRTLRVDISGWEKVDGVIYERLGAQVELVSYGGRRALKISQVLAGSPAATSGLEEGDRLVAMQTRIRGLNRNWNFDSRIALAAFLEAVPAGTELGVEIGRGRSNYQGPLVLD